MTSTAKLDRLIGAIEGDLTPLVFGFGFRVDGAQGTYERFQGNWQELCQLSPDAASSIYHGVRETFLMLSDSEAARHRERQEEEMLGVVAIGRKANPGSSVETIGELYALGEQAIQAEVEETFGDRREDHGA